ncbi:hypothetical protein [Trichormus azollae]|jgi:hypothetical protein|uniref:Uncharacterized protein n=1 Tax=Nostoc azollae (strain 0708) TaxID=551115 RepID=D7DXE8_NOSA0|nr:hypothetical protein [Trichormus azollae]ADI64224.1 hypothetical protein Aazo_2235 ['Nostoc azollae' 0708]
MDVFPQLREFRQAGYQFLCRTKDATFEMTDAILLIPNAYSLANLSLYPVFRRQLTVIFGQVKLLERSSQPDGT